MKNILVLIHDDPGQEARLDAALDLARALRGHLSCLDVSIMRVFPGDGMGGNAGIMMLGEEQRAEARNKARLQRRLSAQDMPWDWIDTTGFVEQCVETAADDCDLIVVNRHCDTLPSSDMDRAVAALIVKGGKPILAVPEDCRGMNLAGKALVAWDGSPPCVAALAASVPLLRLGGAAVVLEVQDGSVRSPATDAVAYLAKHGVSAAIKRCPGELERAWVPILAEARTGDYAYLVMGGFGHPRFVEALFGGVTRKLLKESPIPLLLAH